MNKQDIISKLCADMPQDTCKAVPKMAVDKMTEIIMEFVGDGKRVTIAGFGTFETREMRPRKARNPRTGDAVAVSACVKPVFRPSPKFKKMVSENVGKKEKPES